MKGSLTATTFTAPCSTLVSKMSAVALQLELRKKQSRGTYALRKTILPIRPKPLIPTSVSDILIYGDCEPSKARRGFEESICRLMVEKKISVGIESLGEASYFSSPRRRSFAKTVIGGALNCRTKAVSVESAGGGGRRRTAGQKCLILIP